MSKRRNRSSAPNIPQETLERARRQAEGEQIDTPAEAAPAPTRTRAERRADMGISSSPRRRESGRAPIAGRRRNPRNADEMTIEEIDEIINNPTKIVTAEQLSEEYSIVVGDIRNMAIVAGLLFATLFVIGLVL